MRLKVDSLIWIFILVLGSDSEGQVQACCDNMPSRFGSVSPVAPEGMIWIPGLPLRWGVRWLAL